MARRWRILWNTFMDNLVDNVIIFRDYPTCSSNCNVLEYWIFSRNCLTVYHLKSHDKQPPWLDEVDMKPLWKWLTPTLKMLSYKYIMGNLSETNLDVSQDLFIRLSSSRKSDIFRDWHIKFSQIIGYICVVAELYNTEHLYWTFKGNRWTNYGTCPLFVHTIIQF